MEIDIHRKDFGVTLFGNGNKGHASHQLVVALWLRVMFVL